MNIKSKTIAGVGWMGFEKWSRQILSFAIFTILARLLDPSIFGVVALAGIYMALLEIFVTQGFSMALVQRREIDRGHLDTAFWLSIFAASVIVIVTLLAAPVAANYLHEPALTLILRSLSLAFLITALNVVPSALLMRDMAFDRLAIRSLSGVIAAGVAGLACAWAGLGVWSLVAQQLIGAVAGTIALWAVTSWRPGLSVSKRHLADLRSFSMAIMGNNILWFFSRKSDEAIVGGSLGVAALGAYSVANRLTTIVLDLLNSPAQVVALPALSKIQDDKGRIGRSLVKGTTVMCAIGLPAFTGLLILAPMALPVLFGPKWITAVPVIQVLCIAGMLRVWQGMVDPTMLALGRPWAYLALFSLHAGVTIVASLLAVRTGRAEAVALAQVASNLITGAANFYVLHRFTGFNVLELVAGITRVGLPCAVMACAIVFFQGWIDGYDINKIVALTACIIVGVIVYLALGRITLASELKYVMNAIRSRHEQDTIESSRKADPLVVDHRY